MIQQQTMGKVVAERYADLAFETALPIERVLVKNGQHVRQGQVLAQLDQFKLRTAIAQQERAIEQSQLQIEQAYLQMQERSRQERPGTRQRDAQCRREIRLCAIQESVGFG